MTRVGFEPTPSYDEQELVKSLLRYTLTCRLRPLGHLADLLKSKSSTKTMMQTHKVKVPRKCLETITSVV